MIVCHRFKGHCSGVTSFTTAKRLDHPNAALNAANAALLQRNVESEQCIKNNSAESNPNKIKQDSQMLYVRNSKSCLNFIEKTRVLGFRSMDSWWLMCWKLQTRASGGPGSMVNCDSKTAHGWRMAWSFHEFFSSAMGVIVKKGHQNQGGKTNL